MLIRSKFTVRRIGARNAPCSDRGLDTFTTELKLLDNHDKVFRFYSIPGRRHLHSLPARKLDDPLYDAQPLCRADATS